MRPRPLLRVVTVLTLSALAAPAAAQCKRLETPPKNFDDAYDAVVVARLDGLRAEPPFAVTAQVVKPLKGSFSVGESITARQGLGNELCGDSYPKVGRKVLVALNKSGGAMEYALLIEEESTRFKAYERSVEAHQSYLKNKSSCSTSPAPSPAPPAGAAVTLVAAAALIRRRRRPLAAA